MEKVGFDLKFSINICDVPEKYDQIVENTGGIGYKVWKDGFAVARRSDFVIFCVEAANISKVVQLFGPSMKIGSIACGQVFKYLISDVSKST